MAVPRIVSLLPAATEIVSALGAWNQLVGVSHECDYPAEAALLPRVTHSRVPDGSSHAIDAAVRNLSSTGQDLFALDVAALEALAPDLIITQGLCDVCAISEADVRRVAAGLARPAQVLSLSASTLEEVLGTITQVATSISAEDEGMELVAGLRYRLRTMHLALKASRAPRPRVAVVEWTDPLYAAGHWVPDMVARAGGTDVLATSGQHSRIVAVEHLRGAAPDALVFAPCGFGLERSAKEGARVLAEENWGWAAGIAAWAVDGNALTSRPGPRLCDGSETLGRIMHPQLFGPPLADRARQLQ